MPSALSSCCDHKIAWHDHLFIFSKIPYSLCFYHAGCCTAQSVEISVLVKYVLSRVPRRYARSDVWHISARGSASIRNRFLERGQSKRSFKIASLWKIIGSALIIISWVSLNSFYWEWMIDRKFRRQSHETRTEHFESKSRRSEAKQNKTTSCHNHRRKAVCSR